MDWPPHSLDLSLIEAVLGHLDREKIKRQPTPKKLL